MRESVRHRPTDPKRKRPGRRCGLSPARLPGLLGWTGPPLVECRALAFVSTCSHRPSRLAAWRAMPRFGLDTGLPASNPLAPLHADPVARAIGPGAIGTDLAESSWGGPSSFGSSTTTPLPAPHPEAHRSAPVGDVPPTPRRPWITRRPKTTSVLGRLAAPFAGCGLPRALRTLQQVSVSPPTRR